MKIAFIGGKGLPSKTGTERVVEAITTRLAGRHELTVYCDPDYTPAGTSIEGVRLIRMPVMQGRHARATSLYLFSALHALFKGEYDVVHVNGTETCFILPILRLKYRVVATEHGLASRGKLKKWSNLERFPMILMEYPYLYLSNVATTVSSVDVGYIFSRYKKDVVCIPNGVDTKIDADLAGAQAELDKLGIASNNFILFAARRIDPLKGCHLVLEALEQHPLDIPLLIIGDLLQVPEYGDRLRQMAANKPVYFLPPIDNKALLFGLMKLSKLFIFASFAEAMSMVLLEVASLGVPVLCSDIPENKAVLQQYGLYFRCGDSKDLADRLAWAMDHIPEITQVGEGGREMIAQKFAWDKIARQYEQLYQSCFSGELASVQV